MRGRKTTIIFIPTWMCQLHCSYCDYKTIRTESGYKLKCFGKQWNLGEQIPWQDWLMYLNRFRPYHLELTGGEPTVYSDLPYLLAHIPNDSSWAITSNTLNDVSRFEPYGCVAWTASYHYHDRDRFVGNVLSLKKKGINIRSTLVMTPDNFYEMLDTINNFRKLQIPVNIHPVLKQGFSWDKHSDLISRIREMHDGMWINFVEQVPQGWNPKKCYRCEAGGKYFALMPDGTVLRCYSAILWNGVVGHISDYEPSVGLSKCDNPCIFPCDNRPVKEKLN